MPGPISRTIVAQHPELGERWLYCASAFTRPALLFTENDSNKERLWSVTNDSPFVKDAFHEYVVNQKPRKVNPARVGTKAAAHYQLTINAGETITLALRLSDRFFTHPFDDFAAIFAARRQEADEFYAALQPAAVSEDERRVQRQALHCTSIIRLSV